MAKKRYYQSPKDRMDESRGMERERRRTEMEDSGMIREDRSSIANLPQDVKYTAYPKTDYFMYDLDDTIRGIDVQIDDDVRGERRKSGERYPEKY